MIELKNIHKAFDNKKVIKGLSLSVKKGERVAIIGQSGCGKSTLLRLLMGIHMPDQGNILIEGNDITQQNEKEIRKTRLKFGLLFQSAALFDSMNVFDNVAFMLRENLKLDEIEVHKIVKQKLELVGMAGYELADPSSLSGGQRKRVGLARAIATEPEIMMYDEPTTGLDPVLSTNIEDLITKLSTFGTTTIVITHQISTILRTSDNIYMMNDGKLLPAEQPDTIMESESDLIRHFMSGGLSNNE